MAMWNNQMVGGLGGTAFTITRISFWSEALLFGQRNISAVDIAMTQNLVNNSDISTPIGRPSTIGPWSTGWCLSQRGEVKRDKAVHVENTWDAKKATEGMTSWFSKQVGNNGCSISLLVFSNQRFNQRKTLLGRPGMLSFPATLIGSSRLWLRSKAHQLLSLPAHIFVGGQPGNWGVWTSDFSSSLNVQLPCSICVMIKRWIVYHSIPILGDRHQSVFIAVWWFGTCFFFHILEFHNPNWRTHIFQRGRSTTNQIYRWFTH